MGLLLLGIWIFFKVIGLEMILVLFLGVIVLFFNLYFIWFDWLEILKLLFMNLVIVFLLNLLIWGFLMMCM